MLVWLKAVVLGIVEGATEFLPVSSTGHLIIAADLIDFPVAQRDTFEIFIQLGAILAVFWHYRADLLDLARRAPRDAGARGLIGRVLLAFLPAAAVGFLVHHWIEEHLFSVHAVAWALIVGGLVIWLVERIPHTPTVHSLAATRWRDAIAIGLAQIASLYPGTSRAAATIIGGMLSGLDRPTATRFSFYLALPTLTAASLFSLLKAAGHIHADEAVSLAIGLVTAFASALLVIRAFLAFVQSHDFRAFAYYRIVVGLLLLWWW
ncbi:undecaprenyl-diphosphate phosphatase [bacterium]|nr:undecaprenyl-diphosphate phosphatase [bacterium]